jgi:hypothetical protein
MKVVRLILVALIVILPVAIIVAFWFGHWAVAFGCLFLDLLLFGLLPAGAGMSDDREATADPHQ